MLFIIMTMASGIIEQSYLGTAKVGLLGQLMTCYDTANYTSALATTGGVIIGTVKLFGVLGQMFMFNYAFFTNEWVIMKYFFWSISIGLIVTFALAFFRGVSSG